MPTWRALRALRANRDFGTDEKHIRTKITVMVYTSHSARVSYKIVDCVRMCFSSARNRRSARTGRRPRKFDHHNPKYLPALVRVGDRPLRAARANRVFRADEKRIRTKNTVIVKNR